MKTTPSPKPIPAGHHTVMPYLLVSSAPTLIDFLKRVFGAEETHRTTLPNGRVMHAQVRIGDAAVMMGEPQDPWRPMPASLYVYVDDTDAAYERALAAGATSVMAPADQFYGDRNAGVKDEAGNLWWIATHLEDVSEAELKQRMAAMGKRPN